MLHHEMLRHTKQRSSRSVFTENASNFFPILHILQTSPLVIFSYALGSKKELKEKSFNNIENLARAVQAVVDGIPKDDYKNAFQIWQNRLQRCIEFDGEYFEG